MAAVIIPIALAGMTILQGHSTPDLYVLELPTAAGNGGIVAIAMLAGIAAAMVAALTVFFRYTRTGLAFRAAADDQFAALAVGLRLTRIWASVWVAAATRAERGSSGSSPTRSWRSTLWSHTSLQPRHSA